MQPLEQEYGIRQNDDNGHIVILVPVVEEAGSSEHLAAIVFEDLDIPSVPQIASPNTAQSG